MPAEGAAGAEALWQGGLVTQMGEPRAGVWELMSPEGARGQVLCSLIDVEFSRTSGGSVSMGFGVKVMAERAVSGPLWPSRPGYSFWSRTGPLKAAPWGCRTSQQVLLCPHTSRRRREDPQGGQGRRSGIRGERAVEQVGNKVRESRGVVSWSLSQTTP